MKTALEYKKKSGKDHQVELLLKAGLRLTRQRLLLAGVLFDGKPKHVTAEQVMAAARRRKGRVSLATVYNTLNQFTQAGLLRAVSAGQGGAYFDTNLAPHYHFYDEITGAIWDLPDGLPLIGELPLPPEGRVISGVDIIVRLGQKA